MTNQPFFKTCPDGTVTVLPSPLPNTTTDQRDYTKKPVQISPRRDPLGIEIHGKNFSTVINLTNDDALGIIFMLAYGIREDVYVAPAVQVAP